MIRPSSLLLTVFSLVIALLIAPACTSPRKLMESGNYDAAIDLSLRKLKGKSKKKTQYVRALERSFKLAQQRDLAEIDRLLDENRAENWARVNNLYRDIRLRQQRIQPLTPLRAKDGYVAKFTFVSVDKLEFDSREKAAGFLYERAMELLKRAENGDRAAAREADGVLDELQGRYFRSFRDVEDQRRRARDLGTSYVLFEVKNNAGKILPRPFAERLLAIGKTDLDSRWKEYFFERKSGSTYDYEVVFNLRSIDISPERVLERQYIDEKEVQDGWDYVLDKRGNVMKDTAGNDIKKPRLVRLRANVIEVHQTKAARLAGAVEIYNHTGRTLLGSEPVGTEVLFDHYAATFTGDERALSDETRRRLGNRPVPFPSDADMLLQAADLLKPRLKDVVRGSRAIY